jgi:broad specificity phosphatase PhoE
MVNEGDILRTEETRVLLLRHAESAAPDRFHGAESDIGLSERGHRQATWLAGYLADLRPGEVYSSALLRARETAGPIAVACRQVTWVVPELNERLMGALSGRSKAEHWDDYAAEKERWKAGDLDYARPEAESFTSVRDRSVRALARIARAWPGRTVVVVAHGVLIRIALASLIDGLGPQDFDEIGIDNGAINDLRWDGQRWWAEALNRVPEGLP